MPPEDGSISGDSVERDVLAEHRRLETLFEEVLDSFHPEGEPDAARAALKELRAALETHFDQEDRLYYPAIWALRPDLKTELKGLVDAHDEFVAQLDHLEALLGRGKRGEARQATESLSSVFKSHEEAEEAVLATLDREFDTAR